MKFRSVIAIIVAFTLYVGMIVPVNSRVIASEGIPLQFFEDHFNKSYINENWDVIDGNWFVSTEQQLTVAKGGGHKALVKGLKVDDCSIEGDIILSGGGGDAGFIFRSSDVTPGADNVRGYYAGISTDNGGFVTLGLMNKNWKELKRERIELRADEKYRFKITMKAAEITVYVNEQLILSFTDETYTDGQVGVRMYANSPTYDNIIITNHNDDIVFEEEFPVPSDKNVIGQWDVKDGNWSLDAGSLAVQAGTDNKVLATGVEFEDFTVETNIKVASVGNAGILFRTQVAGAGSDNVQGYYAGFGLDGKITLGRMNNNFTDLEIAAVPGLNTVDPNKFYRLKVVTQGDVIKVYLNDMHKPVITYTDDHADKYSSGSVGLRTYLAAAQFDDFIASEYIVPTDEIKDATTNKNAEPLIQTPFIPLPLGSIEAEGWLLKQLELMKDGVTGYSEELYDELGSNSEWLGGTAPSSNWERPVYYVKGLVALAYTLKDPDLIAKSQKWINWMLESQREDGNFGPASDDDWWPRMVALYILKDYYEATGDERVIEVLINYFQYQLNTLDERPLRDWGKIRFGDNMNVVLWLYNQTEAPFLLDLAQKLNEQGFDVTDLLTNNKWLESARNDAADFYTQHTVNVNQSIKNPAIYYQLSHNEEDHDAYSHGVEHLEKYHNQVTGINAGTEMLSGLATTQGVELCAIVERIHSNSVAAMITGDPAIGDAQEKLAFNSLPGAMSTEIKTHQYYTFPNQVESGYQHQGFKQDYPSGAMQSSNSGFPCCRFNLNMGWPYFVKEMWAATEDGGLGIVAYGPSKVSTKIQGAEIVIKEETNYPFQEEIDFTIEKASESIAFPLKLRIPAWAENATITVNGEAQTGIQSGQYYTIDRTWEEGDRVQLTVPMEVTTSTGVNNSITVERGPLVYSLKIEEDWQEVARPFSHVSEPGFGEYNIKAKNAWNYGLVIDREHPEDSIEVVTGSMPDNPFDQATTPIKLIAKAKLLPSWGKGYNTIQAAEPPVGPVYSEEETVDITLVPFGSETLRITYFPEATDDPAIVPAKYEAENAELNKVKVKTGNNYASGHSFVGEIDLADSYVNFNNINVDKAGTYKAYIWYAQRTNDYSPATAKIIVNDDQEQLLELVGTIDWGRFMATSIEVELDEGDNSIKFLRGEVEKPGFYELDYISIVQSVAKEESVPVSVPVEKITIDGASTITTKGGTLQLTMEVSPENATNKNVTWSIESGAANADISSTGLVTAKANGTVIVKATSVSTPAISATYPITISGQIPPVTPPPTTSPDAGTSLGSGVIKDGDKGIVKLGEAVPSKSISVKEIEGLSLQLEAGETTLYIDAIMLRELLAKVIDPNNVTLEVGIVAVKDNEILNAPAAGGQALVRLAGKVYDFILEIKTSDQQVINLKPLDGGVKITMPYNKGMDEQLLAMYYYNEVSKQWEYVGGTVDSSTNTVTANVDRLGKYAILEYTKTFTDIPSTHWAARTLQILSANRIVMGTSDTHFSPNRPTTRAEFTALLVRSLGLTDVNHSAPFTDVTADQWYADDVSAAYKAGIILGVSENQFAPNAEITREQMAVLLVRAYEHLLGSITKNEGNDYQDANKISSWAKAEVDKAISAGLLQGKGKGIFDPNSDATRAETAQAIFNLLQKK